MKYAIVAMLSFCSFSVAVGAQEIGEAAQSGQLMVVYHWPCEDLEAGLTLLDEMNIYEGGASPIPYSAISAVHDDGALASIDVHSSQQAFEKAAAWQDADAEWQRIFAAMVDACGSADDLSFKSLRIR